MNTLFVLRHGKADSHVSGTDFDRPLTDRGELDARLSGGHIGKIAVPDLIVSSDAKRALTTAQILAKVIDYTGDIVQIHSIYEASVPHLIDVVRGLSNSAKVVVLVGHNPGLEGLVYALAENRESAPRLSTGAFVQLIFEVDDWADVTEESGRIAGCYTP